MKVLRHIQVPILRNLIYNIFLIDLAYTVFCRLGGDYGQEFVRAFYMFFSQISFLIFHGVKIFFRGRFAKQNIFTEKIICINSLNKFS